MTDLKLRCQKWRAEVGFNDAGATTINLYAALSFVGHVAASSTRLARQLAAEASRRWGIKTSARHAVVYVGRDLEREDVVRWCRDLGLLR